MTSPETPPESPESEIGRRSGGVNHNDVIRPSEGHVATGLKRCGSFAEMVGPGFYAPISCNRIQGHGGPHGFTFDVVVGMRSRSTGFIWRADQ